MRFKLVEAQAYHYGDLDKAKKAELGIMGGRGTGHFGSGFYLIGTYDPDNAYDYAKRGHWVVDLDKYNLFKPRNNTDGYKLHDALRTMNNLSYKETIPFKVDDYWEYKNKIPELMDKQYDFMDNLADIEYQGNNDILRINDLMKDYRDGKLSDDVSNQIKEYNDNLLNQLKSIYSQFNFKFPEDDVQDELFWNGRFDIEEDFKKKIDDHNNWARRFKEAVFDLYLIVGLRRGISEERLTDICKKAIQQTDSYKYDTKEDSTSTLIMKALGYDGIDVTHLNKDADGLSGLDNFTYGSVIYDLKPGTYKKIKDKSN